MKAKFTGNVSIRDSIIGQRYFFGVGFGFHIHCNPGVVRSALATTVPYSTSSNNFSFLGDGSNTPPTEGPAWEDFDNTFVFVGFSHNGSTRSIKYWLNNNFYNSSSPQFTPANTYMTDETNNVQIGVFTDAGGWRDKNISQIAIWNRELTVPEITGIYNAYQSRYNFGENIITTNLIFYYDPSKTTSYSGSGTTLTDLSGNGYTATLVNGVGYSSTDGEGSFTFDGTNDYITLPNGSANAFINQSFTVEFWLKPSVSKTHVFFSLTQDGVTQSRLINRVNSDGSVLFGYYVQDLSSSASAASIGSWQHIVMRYRSSDDTSTIFKNGVQIAQGNQGPLLSSTGRAVRIGQWANDEASEYWNGSMGAMYAYQAALTDSQITHNYNALKTRYGL